MKDDGTGAAMNPAQQLDSIKIVLPISQKAYTMVRSTGRMQLIAQKQYDLNTKQSEFNLCCIKQTITPEPATVEELLDLCNEDLDYLQNMYAKFNRTGIYGITPKEVEAFFGSQSTSK